MSKPSDYMRIVLRSAILWGLLAAAGFYGLLYAGVLDQPFLRRYCMGHGVEYGEILLFFVGFAVLVLKAIEIALQYPGLAHTPLAECGHTAQSLDEQCRQLIGQLDDLPVLRQQGYYPRRLRAAIEHVWRRGATDALDDELKFLADADASRQHSSYSLFRVIVWAIPILGFLGTVIGITMALNALKPEALDESMVQVTTGLGVKFDTTALALTLAMLLMFIHFFVDRAENGLLEQVDERVKSDMTGRFRQAPAVGDGNTLAVRRMAEAVVQATERLVQRQAELWQASMDAAAARWAGMADEAAQRLKQELAGALTEGLKEYAERLAAAEQSAAEANRRHWDKIHQTEAQNVQALSSLQSGVAAQAQVLGRAIEASGEVSRLQDVLNRNLAALAGAKHFEQTVMSLAAVIHLLNARLSESPGERPTVQLEPARRTAHAA